MEIMLNLFMGLQKRYPNRFFVIQMKGFYPIKNKPVKINSETQCPRLKEHQKAHLNN